MRPQPLKTTLIMSAIFTAAVVVFFAITQADTMTPASLLLNAMLVFAMVFFTMRLTNRVTAAAVNRWGPKREEPQEAPPPPEPTSRRPEHAQRRRSRRRQRGRRRSGE